MKLVEEEENNFIQYKSYLRIILAHSKTSPHNRVKNISLTELVKYRQPEDTLSPPAKPNAFWFRILFQ